MNREFIERLDRTFDSASMADVARRLNMPHATVRNYYLGRLPAPEVLIRIADETGVSLNWLLTGKGDMYGSQRPPIGLGRFVEEKIEEIIDRKLAAAGALRPAAADADAFDVAAAVKTHDDPQKVMNLWFAHEGRQYPRDYGVVFFEGWNSFSTDEKVEAVYDAKRVLDRSLRK